MNPQLDFLHVQGLKIINGRGETLRLRGFCLGGWMNMENFISGYPGHESGMRAALAGALGEGKAGFFIERFMQYFITEEDLAFIKSLGCNVVRVPFNYRLFESDERPFEYKSEGFALLDRLIGWARRQGLYVILDLHAVQGWQNRGWHCDNPARQATFWGQKVFEDRAVALWEELARHYRDEPWVAGYNLMNEPDADDVSWLNHFYRRVAAAVRTIDPDHILFLEGNRTSQEFETLDPPFARDLVYSSHNYVAPGLQDVSYPGEIDGKFYDRRELEKEYLARAAFMLRHGVPNWVGEFGCIFNGGPGDADRLRVLADMVDIIEKADHHWTIWSYKDIGKMGLVTLDPESEWMHRTHPVRAAKTALRCDSWIERNPTQIDAPLQQIVTSARNAAPGAALEAAALSAGLDVGVRDTVLSQVLLPAFAAQFQGMGEHEIDRMMQSFAFRNCLQRTGLVDLIKGWIAQEASG